MIFPETDSPIPGLTTAEYPHVRYAMPVNFWPNNEDRLLLNVRAILDTSPQEDIAVTLDSHLFERHFSQAIPPNTDGPYLDAQACADNYDRAVSGLGVNLHADCLRQLRRLRKALGHKSVQWVYCRPESGLWYQGSDKDEADRWEEVRTILIARGIAHVEWGKAEWHRFTYRAYNGFLRQVLAYLDWLQPLGPDLNYWFANGHGDELGVHIDDWGNKVPPITMEPEQWADLYVYPPENGDTQLARAVNFARHARNAVVHLRMGPIPDGKGGRSVISPSDVIARGQAVLRAGGHVMMFCGDPSEPQGSSWFPPDGSVGAAVVEFCKECR